MKKGLLWTVTSVLILLLALMMSSCNDSTEMPVQSQEISVTVPQNDDTSMVQSEIPVILESNTKEISMIEFSTNVEYIKPYKTLQECIDNSENIRSIIDTISHEDTENTANQVLIENDTRLVFERTLKENIIYSDTFADDMEQSLENQKDAFIEIINLFEWGVDNDNITVSVRYKDSDGNVIFEKEFDNETL